MKKGLLSFIALLIFSSTQAQPDSIRYRIVLIGDAGEKTEEQKIVMQAASEQILKNKTSVLFLGDNIYPRGFGLKGSRERVATQEILQSQFKSMRQQGAPVYFIPGNHDWDKSGADGYTKIIEFNDYISEQNDSLLRMAPPMGCPGPYEISISDSLVIIAMDTEWWLYPFDIPRNEEECECETKAEIKAALEKLVYKNRYKTIVMAMHHPFQTYGAHGGYFSLRDHLFPLTAINKKLYIPLPGIGSLYPLLRRTFPHAEDLRHPLYAEMREVIDKAFNGFLNVVYVAGHEHALELIKGEHLQVVSGSGSKKEYVKKGRHALLAESQQGYVVADFMLDRTLQFSFYKVDGKQVQKIYVHKQLYKAVRSKEDSTYSAISGDSVNVQLRASFDQVSSVHRKLLGENYRKDWAASMKLPVIRISSIYGGLVPIKRGGGMQTSSLRLKDKEGKEWVLRSLNKDVNMLLPKPLHGTFASDLLDDEMTAQHPFAPLIVPVLANAASVPHASPVIGIVAPEENLGIHFKTFANRVCLLEEREPLGKSDNTNKMLEQLRKDNDNTLDGRAFLRARMLDLLISDWDRHRDQWRWASQRKGKDKYYEAVPRDRDQALYVNQGVLPTIASRSWLLPTLQGLNGKISRVKYSLFKTNFINSQLASQVSYDEWMDIARKFTQSITDSVIEASLKRLPIASYNISHTKLYQSLRERRDNLTNAMEEFYRFINQVVDIQATNKNEKIEITDAVDNGLLISIRKISEAGNEKDILMSKVFDPRITREVRIYLEKGKDKVWIDVKKSPIRLRIIGGEGKKTYDLLNAKRKIKVYERTDNSVFIDDVKKFKKRLSNDSLNTAFVPVNLYNITQPVVVGSYNLDDGVLLGGGIKHTHQGFRKTPYSSVQHVSILHSFATNAFRFTYKGEWLNVFKNIDLTISAIAKAPNNTQNFFGRGNETGQIKIEDNWIRYYRTRFSVFQVDPALRWRNKKGFTLIMGSSLQYYAFDADENQNRFINNTSKIGSYDSLTIDKSKLHLGLIANFTIDKRNNKVLPSWGTYFNVVLLGYNGLNAYAKSFGQIVPELAIHKSLNARSTIVISERLGGGVTFGKTAFYQSLFLGAQDNLVGFRKYRFAGQHMLYNNIELRVKLKDIHNYLLPGQFGLTGFYDVGRVWETGEKSTVWHQGVGGGIYFAPIQLFVFQFIASHSVEGWYPFFTMNFRY